MALVSAGALQAAPWDRGRPGPPPPRHDHHPSYGYGSGYRHGSGYGYGRSFHNRLEVQAQLRLRQLGYYRGPIDGRFGRMSRAALVRFQWDSRLPRTGRLDGRTLRALRIR